MIMCEVTFFQMLWNFWIHCSFNQLINYKLLISNKNYAICFIFRLKNKLNILYFLLEVQNNKIDEKYFQK